MASIAKTTNGTYRVHVFKQGKRESATFRTKREATAWGHAREADLARAYRERADTAKKMEGVQVHRSPAYFGSGVYILFNADKITYVGKSTNVLSRIASHAAKGRRFTHYSVVPCAPSDLDGLEQRYIDQLKPSQNKALPPVRFRA